MLRATPARLLRPLLSADRSARCAPALLYSTRSRARAFDYGDAWYGQQLRATTILSVKKNDQTFIIGDGQVTLGSQIIKPNAKKVRPLERGDGVVAGFAGATADAMTLFERLESKLDEHQETMRACVEMAKSWRMDKYLRRLEAVMIVVDKSGVMVTLTGTGDVISPAPCRPDDPECTDSIIGIGSGGHFATAAARALIDVEGLDAESIGRKSMAVAADMCVYTNHNFVSELLVNVPAETPEEAQQRAEAAAAAAPPKEGEAPADAGSKE